MTNASSIGQVAKELGLSVQPLKGSAKLQAARSRFLAENTALITNIPEQMRERVEGKVRAGVESGKRWETIAKEMQEEGDIGERRARLIARDQVNKYNGALTEARQTGLGITHYRWSGAMDGRERPEHVALQGLVFAWDKPPPGGNPGYPIQCRCVAIPVVSEKEKRSAVELTPEQLAAKTAAVTAEKGGRAKKGGPAKVAPVAGKAAAIRPGPPRKTAEKVGERPVKSPAQVAAIRAADTKLADHLENIATKEGQGMARDAMRQMYADADCRPFDKDMEDGDELLIGVIDSWQGSSVSLKADTLEGAKRWLRQGHIDDFVHFLSIAHEAAHGVGISMTEDAYLTHGLGVEVVDEMACIELGRLRYGYVASATAYQSKIAGAIKVLAARANLTVEVAEGVFRSAALKMKQAEVAGLAHAGQKSVGEFFDALETALRRSAKLSKSAGAALRADLEELIGRPA